MLTALILSVAAACQPADNRRSAAAEAPSAGRQRILRYLDPDHRSFAVGVAEAKAGESRKFVSVEIGEVHNPARHALTFEVSFRSARGQNVPLGLFSLFPADNPGRFIVATAGKAEGEGEIVVTLQEDGEPAGRDVRAGIAAIGFAAG